MRRYLQLIGHLLVVLSLFFFFKKLINHIGEIPPFEWSGLVVLGFFSAVFSGALVVAIGALIWGILLRGGGTVVTFRDAYIIVGYSQIAKYLPGNVFHYLGRITLGRRAGIPSEAILLSLSVETFLAIVMASLVATSGLLFDDVVLPTALFRMGFRGYLLLLIAAGLSIAVITSLSFVPGSREWIRSRATFFSVKETGLSALLFLVVFAAFGFLISILIETLWGLDTGLHWYQFSWGFALAWVLGFIIPGAPGGIGIRETILVGLYGQVLGDGIAIGLAGILRVVTSLGDLLAFGVALWLRRKFIWRKGDVL